MKFNIKMKKFLKIFENQKRKEEEEQDIKKLYVNILNPIA